MSDFVYTNGKGIEFRAGMRVRGWDNPRVAGQRKYAYIGTIVKFWKLGNDINGAVDLSDVVYPNGTKGIHMAVYSDSLEKDEPLDDHKPIRCRDGRPVVRASRFNIHPDRPWHAEVKVGDLYLDLTFDAYGRFCPSGDSPIDLVNA